MMLYVFLVITIALPIDSIYQSTIILTSMGMEYQSDNNVQLLSTELIQTDLLCFEACNQLSSCRTLDYDTQSKRCRLFEGDSTTGSIISSSSTTSFVGTVYISPNLYSSIYGQSCQLCEENRYQVCSTNTSTCQCPEHTYWNGLICALQLFQNEPCDQVNSCRSDLNLTCLINCYDYFPTCLPSAITNVAISSTMNFGTTVAGLCNSNTSTNQTLLSGPGGIALNSNNSLYVANNPNSLLLFGFNNRTGTVVRTFGTAPTLVFFDNRTSNIYISVVLTHLVYIWPTNTTIPPDGITFDNCSLSCLYTPTGVAVDSVGNVYISSLSCNWVTKWAPNASSSTLIAGSPTGAAGSGSLTMYAPYGLALDEPNSFIYVVDRYNYRIQRFPLNGSGIGVTVAGGNGIGSAANQLSRPIDIHLSKIDGSLYIVDCYNNRIQKWAQNATVGITVAGSSNGTSGNSPYLLNKPGGIAIDDEEKYLYISDSTNNRIQRFNLN